MSSVRLRRHRLFYNFTIFFFSFYYKVIFGMKIKGSIKTKSRSVLFCMNHRSFNDPPIAGILLYSFRRSAELFVLAKMDLFKIHPLAAKILGILNAIPLQRNGMDADVIKKSIEVLEQGNYMIVFPEGTRNKTKGLLEGKAGAGYIALKSKAVVIPILLKNTDEHPLKQLLRIKRIEAVIGDEIILPNVASNSKNSRKVTDIIMNELGALENV